MQPLPLRKLRFHCLPICFHFGTFIILTLRPLGHPRRRAHCPRTALSLLPQELPATTLGVMSAICPLDHPYGVR